MKFEPPQSENILIKHARNFPISAEFYAKIDLLAKIKFLL